ncbi:MAG: lipase family protein [Bacteroidota bacterium]|nr:lipase family protein [Bacteroidota bacterium]
MKCSFLLITLLVASNALYGQALQPGFSKEEYIALLKISAKQVSFPLDKNGKPDSTGFERVYKSPAMGLQNQWDLWSNKKGIAVISIRGTTSDFVSWLANFYAAMVPAKGSLQLEKNYRFDYNLANDTKAAVHTGWLIGTGMLVRDMLPKIDSLYESGNRNILIMGHSQGGAIAYLLTSHLYQLRKSGRFASDLVFKTYCSAAPKPGNLYYAYEFENMTAGGWAFNVVNTSDWVPEMPVTVQTTTDCNVVNPFVNALPVINKQKFVQRFVLKKAYKRLSGPPRKSQEEYQYILGEKVYSLVKKTMPEFVKPDYFESINYVRTGTTIVLSPDANYLATFPDNPKHLFMHHLFEPYFYLVNQLK